MVLSEKHKKNMKEVASWLRDNPGVEIEYSIFSSVETENASSLDNHEFGDPLGWAAAILERPAGMSFVEFAQNELGIEPGDKVWHFLVDRTTKDGAFIHCPGVLVVAEFVAMQFDWISGGKSIAEFLEELGK